MSDAVRRPARPVSSQDEIRLLDWIDKVFNVTVPYPAPWGSADRCEVVGRMIEKLGWLTCDLEGTLGGWPAVTGHELGVGLLDPARVVHTARSKLSRTRAGGQSQPERIALARTGEHATLVLDTRLQEALSYEPSNFAVVKAAVRDAVVAMIAAARGTDTGPVPSQAKEKRGGTGRTKGKNIDAKMLKVVTEWPECFEWSSATWADHLNCAEGTVRETTTWRERLAKVRALYAVDRAERMDTTRTNPRGRRVVKKPG